MDHLPTRWAPEPRAFADGFDVARETDSRNVTFDLLKHAEQTPQAPALILPDRNIHYDELNHLTWKFAQYFFEQGVRAGDVVALTFADELGLILTMLALTRLGAVMFSIPRSASSFQRIEMAASVKVAYLATDRPAQFDAGVPALPIDCQKISNAEMFIDRDILCEIPAAPWLLITGSGSTGKQKKMPLMHSAARARFIIGSSSLDFVPTDRIAPLGDLDFASAKSYFFSALWCGASCCLSTWAMPDPIRHCIRQAVTVVYATVYHAEKMLETLPPDCENALGGIRAFVVAASPVSDDLRQRIKKSLTPNLYVRYGINESGLLTVAGPPEVFDVSATIGKQIAGVEIEIVDSDMQPIAANTIGQIRIRTPGLVTGYLDDEVAAVKNFRDGWLFPDDLGRRTDDGQVIFCGRADHMMIMNGINIYPAEIEQVLTGHPAVRRAAAMPIQHRVHQDVPVCAAVLHKDAQITEQALLRYARDRLGSRGPVRIAILNEIPCDAQGKLNRETLRQQIADQLALHASEKITRHRQLPLYVNVTFSIPAQPPLSGLDAWLNGVLGIHIGVPEAASGVTQLVRAGEAAQWLWRVLLLTRQWMHIGRVPIFDSPKIISLAPDSEVSGKWNAKVALALIENLSHAIYCEVLNGAFQLCAWAAPKPTETETCEVFFNTIQKLVNERVSKIIANGNSTLPVLRVAHEKDIPFIHLGGGIFQLGWGKSAQRVDRSTTRLDSAMGSRMSQNKALTAVVLRAGGLPAPEHEIVATLDDALRAARRIGWPVVVKPAELDRGEGVTMDVADDNSLREAFEFAAKLTRLPRVIVERQVAGLCHRLFIANGVLLYAVKRLPMSVRGNASATVAELVASEVTLQRRRPPWERSEIVPLDDLARLTMQAAGVCETSVPANGVLVALRRIESTEWGGVDEDVTAFVHPENIQAAVRATELLGLNVAGVDLISLDISKPWYETGAIINEVNFAPLLGGGEISERHIPMFLDRFIAGCGRIPLDVFVGGDAAWHAASQRWQSLVADGTDAYLSNAVTTVTPSGTIWMMPFESLYRRTHALLLSEKVGFIILVVQTDEFLYSGLPVQAVDAVTEVDSNLMSYRHTDGNHRDCRIVEITGLLKEWREQ